MRLSQEEKNVIINSVKQIDPLARVYLFGSRVDDTKKGGDVDILIFSSLIDRYAKRRIRRDFYEKFGEQRMDIVINTGDPEDPFIKKIIKECVEI